MVAHWGISHCSQMKSLPAGGLVLRGVVMPSVEAGFSLAAVAAVAACSPEEPAAVVVGLEVFELLVVGLDDELPQAARSINGTVAASTPIDRTTRLALLLVDVTLELPVGKALNL
jgi:hypothetical protein